jgi:predicted metal-dependent hydrolase
MVHKKLTPIKERKFQLIINEEYQRAKRILKPLLKGQNRSFIYFRWSEGLKKTGGTCRASAKLITFNTGFRDENKGKWSDKMFVLTLRHEICHLVEPNHGKRFLKYLEQLGGHRYVGQEAFIRTKKRI